MPAQGGCPILEAEQPAEAPTLRHQPQQDKHLCRLHIVAHCLDPQISKLGSEPVPGLPSATASPCSSIKVCKLRAQAHAELQSRACRHVRAPSSGQQGMWVLPERVSRRSLPSTAPHLPRWTAPCRHQAAHELACSTQWMRQPAYGIESSAASLHLTEVEAAVHLLSGGTCAGQQGQEAVSCWQGKTGQRQLPEAPHCLCSMPHLIESWPAADGTC